MSMLHVDRQRLWVVAQPQISPEDLGQRMATAFSIGAVLPAPLVLNVDDCLRREHTITIVTAIVVIAAILQTASVESPWWRFCVCIMCLILAKF